MVGSSLQIVDMQGRTWAWGRYKDRATFGAVILSGGVKSLSVYDFDPVCILPRGFYITNICGDFVFGDIFGYPKFDSINT
jgi:hypothetical protein